MDKNVLYNVVASLLNAAYGHETKVTHSWPYVCGREIAFTHLWLYAYRREQLIRRPSLGDLNVNDTLRVQMMILTMIL